jgi:hypothetical protein
MLTRATQPLRTNSAIGELAEHSDGCHRVPLTDALIAAAW